MEKKMTENELLALVSETIEYDGQLTRSNVIEQIEEWDSLGQMAILSLLDSLKLEVNHDSFVEAETVGDFISAIKLG